MSYIVGKKVTDDGVWKDFRGAKLLIGRAGSVEFLQAQERHEKPYKKKISRDTLSAKKAREINIATAAEAILLDWKQVVGEDGKAIVYTAEIGAEALANDPDMLEFIVDVSIDNDNFAVEVENEIVKKSVRQ